MGLIQKIQAWIKNNKEEAHKRRLNELPHLRSKLAHERTKLELEKIKHERSQLSDEGLMELIGMDREDKKKKPFNELD